MPRWLVLTLSGIAGLIILYLISPYLWWVIKVIAVALYYGARAVLGFFVNSFLMALSLIEVVAAGAIVILCFIVAVGIAGVAGTATARVVTTQLIGFGEQLDRLRADAKFDALQTAKDTAFLAFVAAVCGLIAYMGTDDFLNQISAIRFFAACGIGLVAAKLLLFFPSRLAKACGILLTLLILAGCVLFVAVHYEFDQGMMVGLARVKSALLDRRNEQKTVLMAVIAMLSVLTLYYPFTWVDWKRLLSTPPRPASE